LLLLLGVALSARHATAQEVLDSSGDGGTGLLTVAVKLAPPFVIETEAGYDGLAITLWEDIAAKAGWRYRYQRMELAELLTAVSEGRADIGLGAITVTTEREARLDFSHPLTSSGTGIAVLGEDTAGWASAIRALVSPGFVKVVLALAALLLMVGLLLWLAERRRNPDQFGGSAGDGIGSGFWFAAVTMTTVGYGDKAPLTLAGRALSLLWMFAGLIIVSSFTAAITSALTVQHLNSRIQSVEDLNGRRIATVRDSTSARWLLDNGYHADSMADAAQALEALKQGRTDAVIYDAPLLNHLINEDESKRMRLLPIRIERQDYALAVPDDSPLLEPLNAGLLEHIAAPGWEQLRRRYLGSAAKL
jgi:ABC-type amino acid transport substrate-binding protein